MKPKWNFVFGILLAAAIPAALLLPSGQGEQRVGTGLILATPERLRGIPLAFTPYAGETMPASVDLSPDMPPPGLQGSQNSCVGWALAYGLKSYQEKLEDGRPYLAPDGRVDASRVFSPSFIYNQCNNGKNVPILYSDAFNVLSQEGAATWADMPYNPDDFSTRPGPEVLRKAAQYKIDFWRQVNVQDIKEVKAHLHAGYPVLIGAQVDQAFVGLPAGQVWNSIGTPIGGHAMVTVGYDDGRQAFRLMNSWGPRWCDGGFCWINYDHFRKVVGEGYVAKDARSGPPPQPDQPQPKPQPDQPQPLPKLQPETPIFPVRPTLPATLAIVNVGHNMSYPDRPDLGFFMRFDGTLEIPPGLGSVDQVVISFYYDAGRGVQGLPVRSFDVQFADVNGNAACGTQRYPIPPEGLRTQWIAWIPYAALAVPPGQWVMTRYGNNYQYRETGLVAQATLFLDNFGVTRSPFVPFFVRK